MRFKIKELVYVNIGYIAVSLICLLYVGTSIINIEQTGKTVYEIAVDSALYFTMGILINRILDAQGLMIGSRDPRVYETMKLHNETVNRVYPYMNHMDEWCDLKNKEALFRARRNYLSRYGMRYTDYFDDDGVAKEFPFQQGKIGFYKRIYEHVKYCKYRHAVRMKLTRLSTGLLISDAGETEDPYKMGRSKSEYIKAATKKDIVVKTLIAFLIGYYSVPSLLVFNIPDLIWKLFQVGMLFAMGVMSMQSSIIFVTEEYRSRIIKKIDVLQQFENSIKEEQTHEQNKQSVGKIPDREPEREAVGGDGSFAEVLRVGAGQPESEPENQPRDLGEEPQRLHSAG